MEGAGIAAIGQRAERGGVLPATRSSSVAVLRLEAGVFKLPKAEAGTRSVELRASELAMILDGIEVSRLKRTPRYELAARTSIETDKKIAMRSN